MANFEQIKFKNEEAPYLSKQNLSEMQTRMNQALDDTKREIAEEINPKFNDKTLKKKKIL